jgi:hypothetical protein
MAGNRCECCGVKASKAKGREQALEVHHREGVLNWSEVMEAVYTYLLVHPDKLEVLCPKCHSERHTEEAMKVFNNEKGEEDHASGEVGKEVV